MERGGARDPCSSVGERRLQEVGLGSDFRLGDKMLGGGWGRVKT